MDSTLIITIHNVHGWPLDPAMLRTVFTEICALEPYAPQQIDVYPRPAEEPTWRMRVKGRDGSWRTAEITK